MVAESRLKPINTGLLITKNCSVSLYYYPPTPAHLIFQPDGEMSLHVFLDESGVLDHLSVGEIYVRVPCLLPVLLTLCQDTQGAMREYGDTARFLLALYLTELYSLLTKVEYLKNAPESQDKAKEQDCVLPPVSCLHSS